MFNIPICMSPHVMYIQLYTGEIARPLAKPLTMVKICWELLFYKWKYCHPSSHCRPYTWLQYWSDTIRGRINIGIQRLTSDIFSDLSQFSSFSSPSGPGGHNFSVHNLFLQSLPPKCDVFCSLLQHIPKIYTLNIIASHTRSLEITLSHIHNGP